MKRLEDEVLGVLHEYEGGITQTAAPLTSAESVGPHQFLGIELNERAAPIAELVLWIGHLQWQVRTFGTGKLQEPVLHNYHNIECRDDLLVHAPPLARVDTAGQPVTRWDGRTLKPHEATGAQVPDKTARTAVLDYPSCKPAEWPAVDYIVGNPPLGTARMREALGDGYTEAVRATYPEVPESADFVMYWWHKAAELLKTDTDEAKLRRFGFITTNSLRQTFNRRVLQHHMSGDDGISLVFAIPDHPWVETAEGADVRIAMTVSQAGTAPGALLKIIREEWPADEVNGSDDGVTETPQIEFETQVGLIQPDLTIGAAVPSAVPLLANDSLAYRGVQLIGSGFIVSPAEAAELGLGRVPHADQVIRPYLNGRDLTQNSRGVMVIDLYGREAASVQRDFPEIYHHVLQRVKPERDQNNRAGYRANWWMHGEPRRELRASLAGLPRYIATVETSKHRFFVFLEASILPDNKLICFALSDAFCLGILSSRFHSVWALAAGSRLEDRPVYVKTTCFHQFPFPAATPVQVARIRELGERLDAHRKRQQALHPGLTMTNLYNVVEKLRVREPLSPAERATERMGLASVVLETHQELDAAVANAYGWPTQLADQEILTRIVELNAERAEDERRGAICYLRPEYQAPGAHSAARVAEQEDIISIAAAGVEGSIITRNKAGARELQIKLAWPSTLAEQAQAVRTALSTSSEPATANDLARLFTRAQTPKVAQILETLATLGQARRVAESRYLV